MKSLLAITFFGVALAPCLWDRDTLATELRGLPKALDMVLGKWHRHSEAYYRERIERLAGKERLTLGECDDLAVAYEHVRDRDKAIAVLARGKEALGGKDETLNENLLALQNNKKMKMKKYGEAWYQFHLEQHPAMRQAQRGGNVRFARR